MDATQSRKRALVTGGSGDIGGAVCRALAEAGHHVIVHANQNLARAEEVTAAIVATVRRIWIAVRIMRIPRGSRWQG